MARLSATERSQLPDRAFAYVDSQGRRRLTTDRSGLIVLPDDLTGAVFLSAVVLTPPAEPGGPFTSEWATLTIDVSVR